MAIILGIASGLAFVVAFLAFGTVRSDIQLGIVATAFFAGLILFGLAGVAAGIGMVLKRLRQLNGDDR